MIQKFAADFELETANPEKYNISTLIKSSDKPILQDIYLLSKLAFLIRTGRAKVVIKNDE